jgi:hypothetical protein
LPFLGSELSEFLKVAFRALVLLGSHSLPLAEIFKYPLPLLGVEPCPGVRLRADQRALGVVRRLSKPQGTAQAYAPSYYNAPYSSLDPEQKMPLEDHLANQSNQAWRTTALVGSAVGRLAQGTGTLLFAARH